MSGNATVKMGDRGRIVVPADLRARHGFEPGTALVLVDTDDGILLISREALLRRVRDRLRGSSLAQELADDRRGAAATEDAAS